MRQRLLATTNATYNPFDPDKTNPLHAFEKPFSATVDHKAIDPELADLPSGRSMPSWPDFRKWLGELTGCDVWALFAAENVKGVLPNLPENLNCKEKTPERIEWLINQIPPAMRAREQERLAEAVAKWKGPGSPYGRPHPQPPCCAEARMRQRGLRDHDLALVLDTATPLADDAWLLTTADADREIARRKREVEQLQRLSGCKVVVSGDVVVTVCHMPPAAGRRAIRRGREAR